MLPELVLMAYPVITASLLSAPNSNGSPDWHTIYDTETRLSNTVEVDRGVGRKADHENSTLIEPDLFFNLGNVQVPV